MFAYIDLLLNYYKTWTAAEFNIELEFFIGRLSISPFFPWPNLGYAWISSTPGNVFFSRSSIYITSLNLSLDEVTPDLLYLYYWLQYLFLEVSLFRVIKRHADILCAFLSRLWVICSALWYFEWNYKLHSQYSHSNEMTPILTLPTLYFA